MHSQRARQIERFAWVAVVGNLVLAAVKIAAGVLGGSLAVLGDGLDSTIDVGASAITLFAARIIAKPPDRTHPYGHFRAETIASKTLSFVIFFVGAQLALSTVHRLAAGVPPGVPEPMALYAVLLSVAGKAALAILLSRSGRRLSSSMLVANGKNMRSDILISGGVLVGLVFTRWLHLPLLDPVVALAISVWIMKTAFGIFLESNKELMDGLDDPTIYPIVFEAVAGVSEAANPHRARVRQLANMYLIDLDIEVDGSLTVAEAHDIAVRVEKRIKERLDNVYDIMVHVEPLGNVEDEERFGITEKGEGSGGGTAQSEGQEGQG
ncbi:MAG: cation transporter [Spirochaetales bacterium]|nr:cation transporter [Spirochaetales bacterium]